jgi:4-amino-4-deoxy-L-arabinose transferase-like glycosyltransferase
VVLFGVRGVASYLSAVTLAAVSSRLVRDLRQQMFAKLMSLPSATLNVSTPLSGVSSCFARSVPPLPLVYEAV